VRGFAAFALPALLALGACSGPTDRAVATEDAARLAAMQQRSFATTDRYLLVRAVTATLLSADYTIGHATPAADTICASKDSLRVRVTITPHSSSDLLVRVEAWIGEDTPPRDSRDEVDDPAFYQDQLFAPLAKTLGLPARPVT
jgi:hypothetical protein